MSKDKLPEDTKVHEAELVTDSEAALPVAKKLNPTERFDAGIARYLDRFGSRVAQANEVLVDLKGWMLGQFEKLTGEHAIEVSKLNDQLNSARKAVKEAGLTKKEAEFYEYFKAWTDSEEPLKLLFVLVNAEWVEDGSGWLVKSSRPDHPPHFIPADLSSCPCEYCRKHHHCYHLTGVALRTKVQWALSTKFKGDLSRQRDNDDV